jgi:hypothetical protein
VQIFVDGSSVGTVGERDDAPLGLTPGRNHIEIRAPGYQTSGRSGFMQRMGIPS